LPSVQALLHLWRIIQPIGIVFLTAEKNSLEPCFTAYEAANKFYDQILQKLPVGAVKEKRTTIIVEQHIL
jgi:hypothetical protein